MNYTWRLRSQPWNRRFVSWIQNKSTFHLDLLQFWTTEDRYTNMVYWSKKTYGYDFHIWKRENYIYKLRDRKRIVSTFHSTHEEAWLFHLLPIPKRTPGWNNYQKGRVTEAEPVEILKTSLYNMLLNWFV